MAYFIDKDALVAEIEKLKGQLLRGACSSQISMETSCKEEAYDEVLAILDSLQEEPVSEELIIELKSIVNIRELAHQGIPVVKIARHIVNWQKNQMIKNAIEAIVKVDAGGYPYIPQMELYDYDKDVPLAKEGDKYKVVLIKE